MKTKNIFSAVLVSALSTFTFAQNLSLTVQVQEPTCYGSNNGAITVLPNVVSKPTTPVTYSFFWSTSGNTNSISNLGAGTYDVTVVGSDGSSASQTIVLDQPEDITIEGTVTKVTTFGGENGAIDLDVTGLPSSYTVEWSTNNGSGLTQGQLDQTGLSAGTYTVDITTEAGCVTSKTFIVTQQMPIFVTPDLLSNITAQGGFGHMPLVYPNPSNGQVNFRNVDATDVVEIYNQFGTLVQTMSALEGTQLNIGNYTVMIKKADGNVHRETLVVR